MACLPRNPFPNEGVPRRPLPGEKTVCCGERSCDLGTRERKREAGRQDKKGSLTCGWQKYSTKCNRGDESCVGVSAQHVFPKRALLFIAAESGGPTSGRTIRAVGVGGDFFFISVFRGEALASTVGERRCQTRLHSWIGVTFSDLFLWCRFNLIDGSRCELGHLIHGERAAKQIQNWSELRKYWLLSESLWGIGGEWRGERNRMLIFNQQG